LFFPHFTFTVDAIRIHPAVLICFNHAVPFSLSCSVYIAGVSGIMVRVRDCVVYSAYSFHGITLSLICRMGTRGNTPDIFIYSFSFSFEVQVMHPRTKSYMTTRHPQIHAFSAIIIIHRRPPLLFLFSI
jgi:hypothetical protein